MFNYVSNNPFIQFLKYYKMIFIKKLLTASMLKKEETKKEKNIIKRFRNNVANFIGTKKLKESYLKVFNNKKQMENVFLNWPAYGLKKDKFDTSCFKRYIPIKFEGIEALITCDYDKVLQNTFGDYMKLPPKEKQITNHSMEAFWK